MSIFFIAIIASKARLARSWGSVYLIPVILEQQLFDRVSVVHFGGAKMPELYDYRIMVASPVEGGL